MKKSKLASGLAGGGGVLALALGLSMTASQVAAVPYASQIRFGETQINKFLNTDLLYTLNEDADAVTVEVYNLTDDVVVRTYQFEAPDPETQVGRHAISWDNRDEEGNLLPLGPDQFTIRVRVQKTDGSTTWTRNTANSSGKATPQQSLFAGYSANDLEIPTDPTSDQFGLLFVSHSYTPSGVAGVVLLGADLAPVLGNGGGAANVRGQHPEKATPGNFALWKTDIDPLDPDILWWGGQTAPAKAGYLNIGAQNAADIDLDSTSSWSNALFPRGFAIGVNDNSERVAFVAMGNVLYRIAMDTTPPYTLSAAPEILTPATLEGQARYAMDVNVDAAGNVYHLTRLPDGDGRLYRWNKADVDAAPGVLLDETNAAWNVIAPVNSVNFNALHIDRLTGEVYVANASGANPRGIYRVGNVADDELASNPYQLTTDDMIINYADSTLFPAAYSSSQLGHGIATDWQGNLYTTNRAGEEIHSFSPPGRASEEDPPAEYDITTESPTGYFATITFDKSNLVFVDQDGPSDGVVNYTSLREAILSFGPGGINNGFAGTNRIEVNSFGPFDEELPDLTAALDADDFEIVTPNGPVLVLQRGSTWELGRNVSIDGLYIAASSTSTPTGTLVNASSGTQTLNDVWIGALPADANTYTSTGDIPADLLDGSRAFDGSLVRAGDGLTISGASVSGTNVVITQNVDGVDLSGGSVNLTNATISSNSGPGVSAAGPVTLANADVVNNGGAGVQSTSGAVTISGGSLIADNGGSGLSISGSASLTMNATFANPNQILNNGVHGVAYSSAQQYQIRNTLIHGHTVGLDVQSGGYDSPLFNYDLSDVIISGSTTAGIRTSSGQGISAARITLYDNGSGILDSATRTNFWSIELQDAVIAGPGDTGINSPGAAELTIFVDYGALVTAGPDALATAINAPANALDVGSFGQPAPINANPAFRSTTYSSNRSGPDFYLAPTNLSYVGAAKPNADAYDGGSPFQNLGGGSRWTLGPGIDTITVGTSGTQLYETLADAVDAVSSLGTTGGQVLTILIETDLLETRVSRLGIDTTGGGGVIIRPANGVDATVSWEVAPATSSVWYSGQLAIGANQGVNNDVVITEGVVIDGRPAGSPSGTQLTFQGPGRHINLTGGAKGTIIRNMVLDSTSSVGAVIAMNSANLGGVDYHADDLLIENNLIRAASTNGAHVGIVLQNQNATITTSATGMVIRNNRIEYNSSAIFFYPSGLGATVYGNEFYCRQPAVGLDSRGFYFFTSTSFAHAIATTTNIYNNYFDMLAQQTSTVNGPAFISFDFGETPQDQTFNFYNNMFSLQTNTSATIGKLQVFVTGAVSPARLNALHNSIYIRAGAQGVNPAYPPGASSVFHFAPTAGRATVNARNNLIRVEEPAVSVFNTTEQKLADFREDYNTVHLVAAEVGDPPAPVFPNYGRIAGVLSPDIAAWRTASGTGAHSDEAVIPIAPEENPVEGFTGTWTAVADRVTDPNNPVLPNFRWTGVPGDSSVWAGVPGLLTDLPGGNADIDGNPRSAVKAYRGAHEGPLMPGDAIDPDPEEPEGILGDITGDEVVNVADVTALADALANDTADEIELVVGDVDGDNDIDADDLAALVDMIVNP
jgi:hypothetical protein